MTAKKLSHLLGAFLLGTALTVNTGNPGVFAAAQDNSQSTVQQPQATDAAAAAQTPQEPQMPESYEWEIQSNSIKGWPRFF